MEGSLGGRSSFLSELKEKWDWQGCDPPGFVTYRGGRVVTAGIPFPACTDSKELLMRFRNLKIHFILKRTCNYNQLDSYIFGPI